MSFVAPELSRADRSDSGVNAAVGDVSERYAHAGASASSGKRLRIAFLVRALNYGGAERQLVVLATGLHVRGHVVVVIVFYPGGPLEAELHRAGVRVRVLGKRSRWDLVGFASRLDRAVRDERPDILHGYLDVPNVLALGLRARFPGLSVVWGERVTRTAEKSRDWLTNLSVLASRRLSRYPDLVIVNSRAVREDIVAAGYPADKTVVIPNGIDVDRFAPDPAARRRQRAAWGIESDEQLVGLVGRLVPVKDHRTFLASASRIATRVPRVRFVCVGDGTPAYRIELEQLGRSLGLGGRVLWVSAQSDMRAVYNALDVFCSSSAGEAFPNVIAEAMACGVPCVVTGVGDSAFIVGRPALVVPPGQPDALAEQLAFILTRPEADLAAMRAEGRERIVTQFSVPRLIDTTEQALLRL